MIKKREVEIRFRLTPQQRKAILLSLKQTGWKPQSVFQKDIYFCERSFIKAGKEKDCPYVVRIRQSDHHARLAYKSFTDDGSWVEHETDITDPKETTAILEGIGLRAYLTIEKTRIVGSLDELEVTVDTIASLGEFMELEILTNNVKAGRARLLHKAQELGLSEDDVITKGYVQLMEEHLTHADV